MKFDIESWVKENIHGAKLNSTGQLVGECPWCGKPGRFYVDAEKGHYICFKCEEAGRHLVGLLAHVEGISRGEAMRYIMRNAVEFRRKETPQSLLERIQAMSGTIPKELEDVDVPLPKEYIPVYKDGKWKYPTYLKKRGITKETARKWSIGWCRSGRYAGRIVIPIECPNGRSFTARDTTGQQMPRYLNPKGANHGKLLLGWQHHNIQGDVAIVEGPLDAIKMWQHGIPSLAVMGKVLHPEQLSLLMMKPSGASITIILDPEEHEAPYDMAEQLACRFENIFIGTLPDGVDPGDTKQEQARVAYDGAKRYTGEKIGKLTSLVSASRKKLEKIYQ